MKKIKILHCADIHFDTPFKELGKKLSEVSKEELLEVFKKIINIVIDEQVDILLIAGDVFDNFTVNKTTLYFIASQLSRINNTQVFISPGNHDPYNSRSFYEIMDWPENVYIFKGELEKVDLEDLNLTVWGAAFNNQYEKKTLFRNVEIDNSRINLMVIHGEISNNISENIYNPIYLEDIKKSGMEYIAVGHRHEFSGIKREGKTFYAYSGCPQGRGFDEIGDKGIIIGDIAKDEVHLSFRPICKRKYNTVEIDISGLDTYEEVCSVILNSFPKDERENNFFKIVLKGQLKEHLIINEDVLLSKLKDQFYYLKIINNTSVEINMDELASEFSVKGRFVSKMLKILADYPEEDKEIINLAIKLGIQSLSESEVKLDDN